MQQQYPVRMGLVLSCHGDLARAPSSSTSSSSSLSTTTSSSASSSSDRDSDSDSIHSDFCRLFASLKHFYSEEEAHSFALSVASYLLEGLQMGGAFGT